MPTDPLTIWALSDGRQGLENQVLGLAEAIGRQRPADIVPKRIAMRAPHDRLPRQFFGPSLTRLSPRSDPLDAPWPDIVIGCGRQAVPLTMALRKKGSFAVQTQAPRAPLSAFDVVVPPHHDGVSGDMAIPIHGAPNRLTEERLRTDAAALSHALGLDDAPVATALIGGPSKDYRVTTAVVGGIIACLCEAWKAGFTLLISPSRRTPECLVEHLRTAIPGAWIWDGAPVGELENPYFGMLGRADRLFVTEESANMLTDAAFTGRPVHLLRLDGGGPKWKQFHRFLTQHGALNPAAPVTEDWTYPPLRETDRAAAEILRRYEAR